MLLLQRDVQLASPAKSLENFSIALIAKDLQEVTKFLMLQWEVLSCSLMCTKGEEDEDEDGEVEEVVEGEEDSPVSLHPSGSHTRPTPWGRWRRW